MTSTAFVDGECAARFAPVRAAFAANFDMGVEIGASFAATLDGELVVDLWGGHADAARTKPWTRDTIVNVFSTTKAMTALCAHILVDRGLLDLDAPVARYWSEFAQNGKRALPVHYLLSHRAAWPRSGTRCRPRRCTTGTGWWRPWRPRSPGGSLAARAAITP